MNENFLPKVAGCDKLNAEIDRIEQQRLDAKYHQEYMHAANLSNAIANEANKIAHQANNIAEEANVKSDIANEISGKANDKADEAIFVAKKAGKGKWIPILISILAAVAAIVSAIFTGVQTFGA